MYSGKIVVPPGGGGIVFKFPAKVDVEESIVNAPFLQSKNTNNAKFEVRFKQLIRDL
jgi:hypothetical protein